MTTRKTVGSLRLDAQLAYLDGRVKRAKKLNRDADRLAALERANENLYEAQRRGESEITLRTYRMRVRQAERNLER
jgi:hypothetical protein